MQKQFRLRELLPNSQKEPSKRLLSHFCTFEYGLHCTFCKWRNEYERPLQHVTCFDISSCMQKCISIAKLDDVLATWNIGPAGRATNNCIGCPHTTVQRGSLWEEWKPFYDSICFSEPCSNYPFLTRVNKLQSLHIVYTHRLPSIEGYCLNTTLKNGAMRNCDPCARAVQWWVIEREKSGKHTDRSICTKWRCSKANPVSL